MKTQSIRVLDVVIIGPMMIWGAGQIPRSRSAFLLGLLGFLTIAYNGYNYQENVKRGEGYY